MRAASISGAMLADDRRARVGRAPRMCAAPVSSKSVRSVIPSIRARRLVWRAAVSDECVSGAGWEEGYVR